MMSITKLFFFRWPDDARVCSPPSYTTTNKFFFCQIGLLFLLDIETVDLFRGSCFILRQFDEYLTRAIESNRIRRMSEIHYLRNKPQ